MYPTAVEKGNEKKQAVADALKEVLARVDVVGGDADVAEKTDFLYLKGRAHNVCTQPTKPGCSVFINVFKTLY